MEEVRHTPLPDKQQMDNLILQHLKPFSEQGLYRASLDHFRETGKPSGTFRESLHELMDAYCKSQLSLLQEENNYLKKGLDIKQGVIVQSKQHIEQLEETISTQSKRIEELTGENDKLQIQASNYAYQMDMAKRERDKAESELSRLKEEKERLVKVYNSAIADLKAIRSKNPDPEIERLREALNIIQNSHEDSGRAGCTYGDTKYDSLSAVYGYNLCLEGMKSIASSALQLKPEGEK
jgi:chromosome segregation ATPase